VMHNVCPWWTVGASVKGQVCTMTALKNQFNIADVFFIDQ